MIKENVPTGTVGNNSNNNDEENQETGKTITFTIWGQTYNDAVEGDTWEDWMKKQKKGMWCSYNGYLASDGTGNEYVCDEDGKRVAVTAEISNGYDYSLKGMNFTIFGQSYTAPIDEKWEEWCERDGFRIDCSIKDDYVVRFANMPEEQSLLTSEGEKVRKDATIVPGHAYKLGSE